MKEVGNALNSILSFMQRPKALEGFEKLGIQVWADKAKTQFRDVMDVFSELAARWPEVEQNVDIGNLFAEAAKEAGLYSEQVADAVGIQKEFNDVQAAEAAGLAAGIYRRNYLVALLKNWGKVAEVLKTQEQAVGYSMKENERTMETYQKKVEALRTSLTGLAVAVMEAGALDRLKEAADGIRDVVDVFLELPPGVQRAIVAFGEFTAALAVTQLGMRTFFDVGLPTAIRNLAAFVTGMTVAEAQALSLGAALEILATNPWTLAIGGLTAIVGLLIKWRIEAKKAAEEQQKLNAGIKEWQRIAATGLTKEEAPKYSSSIQEIEDLVNKYDELVAKRKKLADQMSKSYEAASNPKLLTEFGQLSKKIEEVEKALKKHNITIDEAKKNLEGLRKAAKEAEVFQFNADAIAEEAQATKSNAETKLKLIQRYQELAKGVKTQADYAQLSAQRQKELSSVAQQLATYYPDLVVQTDKHGNAILFENKALNAQIPLLKELATTSITEAKARIKAEKSKTDAVIAEIRRRLQAMLTEKQAMAKYLTPYFPEELKKSGMKQEEWQVRRGTAEIYLEFKLNPDVQKQTKQLREAESQSKALADALNKLNGIAGETGNTAENTTNSLKDLNDALEQYIHNVTRAVTVTEQLLERTNELYDANRAMYDFYNRQGASAEERIQAAQITADAIGILLQKQGNLHSVADAARQAIADLQGANINLGSSAETTASKIGKLSGNLETYFQNASRATGVSVDLLKAVAKQESGFNQAARSSAGAIGIMQLMPGTARGVGVNPYDTAQNILGGAKVLREALNAFNGNLSLALAAYNAGIGAVQNAIRRAGSTSWDAVKRFLKGETQKYVPAVLANLGTAAAVTTGTSSDQEDEIKRQQQLYEQLGDTIAEMYGKANQMGTEWWRTQKEIYDLTLYGEQGQEYVRAIRQQQINALKDEIDYLNETATSQDDLNKKQALSVQLYSLYADKQSELQHKIQNEADVINGLQDAMSKLNTNTKEGQLAVGVYYKEIATATENLVNYRKELLDIQKEMYNLTLFGEQGQEYVRAMRQHRIDELKNEIDYLDKNAKTQDELNSVQGLSVELYSLYTEKQLELQHKMENQTEVINAAKEAMSKLNANTAEGQALMGVYYKEIATATENLVNYKKELLDTQAAQQDLYVQVFQKARQAQHDLEMQWIEDEKQAELDRLNALKDAAKAASDARIKAIQDEIDALDRENTELNEQKQLLEAQQKLDEARQKLANVQAERNTRIFQNGVWTYIADPKAVKEAEQAVKDAEESFANTQDEINRNRRKRELQDLLDQEQQKQQAEQDSYDKQIKDLQDYWDKKQKDTEKRWKKLLSTEQLNMDAYKGIINLGINAALSKWEAYYRRVQQIMEETGSLVGVELPTLDTGENAVPSPAPNKSSGGSSSNSSGSHAAAGENLLDAAARAGVNIGWNPKTGNVTINGKDALPAGGVPGTRLDPNTGRHVVTDPKLVDQFLNAAKSYQSGGAITSNQLAFLHSGEYVLNAKNVQLLGGFSGVERLVANLSTPKISIPTPSFNIPVVPQVINNDTGVKINRLDLNMPHVYDVSGFVRNLNALRR